jgi:hypothetical protein
MVLDGGHVSTHKVSLTISMTNFVFRVCMVAVQVMAEFLMVIRVWALYGFSRQSSSLVFHVTYLAYLSFQ